MQVCCDFAEFDKRSKAMARLLEHSGCSREEAEHMAPHALRAMQPLFDALKPFIDLIAGLARGADFKPE